jgi:hypothetical protein
MRLDQGHRLLGEQTVDFSLGVVAVVVVVVGVVAEHVDHDVDLAEAVEHLELAGGGVEGDGDGVGGGRFARGGVEVGGGARFGVAGAGYREAR